jgi:NAD+ kinase
LTENSVAVLTKKSYTEIQDVASSLIEHLNRAGFKVYTTILPKHGSAEHIDSIKDLKQLKPDILVTVGGDGSLLWVLREMDDDTPILGVNVGGRGVLSEVNPEEIGVAVERLSTTSYTVEERVRLAASAGQTIFPPALNEIFLTRVSQIRTSTFSITVGGDTIKQRMDGIIISTPTGSTGHSLSFGGPILRPGTQALLLLPVAPLNRLPPIIVPTGPVEVKSDHDSTIVIDGQTEAIIEKSSEVLIDAYRKKARFIRFRDRGLKQLENLRF